MCTEKLPVPRELHRCCGPRGSERLPVPKEHPGMIPSAPFQHSRGDSDHQREPLTCDSQVSYGFTAGAESVPTSQVSTQSSHIRRALENTPSLPPESQPLMQPSRQDQERRRGPAPAPYVLVTSNPRGFPGWSIGLPRWLRIILRVGAVGIWSWFCSCEAFKELKRQHRAAVLLPARLGLRSEATSPFRNSDPRKTFLTFA